MKKFTTVLLVLMLTAFAAFSAETSRFSGNELSVSLGTGYALDNGFKNPYNFNLNAGVSYYLTRNIGVEAELPFFQTKGVSVSEVSVGPVFRIPISDRIAPYAGVNATYNWVDSKFTYFANAGLEVRLSRGWGVFGEGRYTIEDFNSSSLKHGGWGVAGGVRLNFGK